MRHEKAPAEGRGQAGRALARNRLLIVWLAVAAACEIAGLALNETAFDNASRAMHTIALILFGLAFLILVAALAYWADRRVRAEQSHTRAMRAAIDAAGIEVPDEQRQD